MKNPVLPRVFAAILSIVVTIVLFDQVASMGQSGDVTVSASVPVRVASVDR